MATFTVNDIFDGLKSVVAAAKEPVICDAIPALENFDATRYMGSWIEIQHHTGEYFQPDSWRCNQALYTDLDAEGNFKVYNSSQLKWGPRFGAHGHAKCPADSPLGHCFVKFFFQPWEKNSNYNIIDTDYETYSIIYTCGDGNEFLWIMSRTPTMDEATLTYVLTKAKTALPHFDFSKMVVDVQGEENGCKYATAEVLAEYFLF